MEERRKQKPGRRRQDIWSSRFAFLNARVLALIAVVGVMVVAALSTIGYIVVTTFEDRLHEAAVGECYRVVYLRYQINLRGYGQYRRDHLAGVLLKKGISVPVRTLGTYSQRAANGELFLPQTNCPQAVDHPLSYNPPKAIPYGRLSQKFLHYYFTHPPQPPGRAIH